MHYIKDMSSRSVKFEISLKELSVKFEGDIQTAERMQNQITGALNSLASAQNKLLVSGQQATTAPTPAVSLGRRRRRTKKTEGIDQSILEADVVAGEGTTGESNVSGDGASETRRVRRSGAGAQTLLERLKAEGFFSTPRSIADMRAELSRKGHTFESRDISPALVRLTKKEVLQREATADGWSYSAR
ncbi:MAG TPA: hypothetical protein VHT23_08415 [Gemmatimonadaceae bacterium]|jgi:hypothetical protein|nr:hypothetical protein [Gemmatimonadaceae bacterium]